MSSEPTVLFVHGAWHRPDPHYKILTDGLTAAGFSVVAPAMPSSSGARPPTTGLWEDVECIRAEATRLVEEGRPVLVMGHSYGGTVMTNAITAELAWATRQKSGERGGVTLLLYLCAFMPRIGDSGATIWAGCGGLLAATVLDDGVSIPSNPMVAFYNDVEPAIAQVYIDALHVQPTETAACKTRSTAWKVLPVTYVHCARDAAIPASLQARMVDAARADGALEVREVHIDASHSPWLSKLGQVTAATKDAWAAYATTFGYPELTKHSLSAL